MWTETSPIQALAPATRPAITVASARRFSTLTHRRSRPTPQPRYRPPNDASAMPTTGVLLNISVYVQSVFSLCSVYVQSIFSVKISLYCILTSMLSATPTTVDAPVRGAVRCIRTVTNIGLYLLSSSFLSGCSCEVYKNKVRDAAASDTYALPSSSGTMFKPTYPVGPRTVAGPYTQNFKVVFDHAPEV